MLLPLPALRAALAVDRGAFLPLRGLRAAIGVGLALGIGVSIGQPAAGVLAAVGALTAGTVSLTQGARTPLATMAVAGAATALSTAVGSLTAHVLPAAVLALAIWGAVAGLLAGAGPAATVVGVQAVVGLVVLGRFPLTPAGAAAAAGEVLLGSAGQVLLCALLRAPARHLLERRALARLADDLARWCRDPGGSWTSSTASSLEDARTLLQRRPDAPAIPPLRSVLLGLARSRLEVSVLCVAHERSVGHQQARIGRLLAAAAVDLGRFAEVLRTGQEGGAPGDQTLAAVLEDQERGAAGSTDAPRPGEQRSSAAGPKSAPRPKEQESAAGSQDRPRAQDGATGSGDLALRRAEALAGQLRGTRVSLSSWASARPAPSEVLRAARPHRADRLVQAGQALRHPSASAARHAVRLAVLLPLADGVARLLPVQRGYWVALTAVVVLKPDYATSSRRSLGRVIGTLLGVVPATLLVGALHPRGLPLVAVVGVLAWAAYASFQAGFALYSGCLAALAVVLLDVVTPGAASVAGARAVDTLLGGALALLGFLVLPAWEGPALREAVARLIEAEDVYAVELLSAYGERPASREVIAGRARQVRQARAAAESSLGRAAAEPVRTGSPVHATLARDVLAGTARVASSLHVLHAQAVEGVPEPATTAELAPFTAELHAALLLGAEQVRSGGPDTAPPDLRAAGRLLIAPAGGSPARRVLAREAEELIDAVDTLLFATGLGADRALG